MKCGKGPEAGGNGGSGVCPVAAESRADGLNGGSNGGRICWVIADGRTCDEIKCSGMHREGSCFTCGFRYRVMQEEGLLSVCRATGIYLAGCDKTAGVVL